MNHSTMWSLLDGFLEESIDRNIYIPCWSSVMEARLAMAMLTSYNQIV